MSIVSKEEYWTTILNDYSQFGQITTEDSEFNSIANDVWNVLENSFIKIDDEERVIKWEETTGLSGEGLTIFQRKANILYTLTVKNYLPISLITRGLNKVVGEGNYELSYVDNTLSLKTNNFAKAEDVNFILDNLLPKNMTTDVESNYLKYADCTSMSAISTVNANYHKDLTAEGEWIYPLPKLTSMYAYTECWWPDGLRKFCVPLPKVTNMYRAFSGSRIECFDLDLPLCENLNWLIQWTPYDGFYKGKIVAPKAKTMNSALSRGHKNIKIDFYVPNVQSSTWTFQNCSFIELKLTTQSIAHANGMFKNVVFYCEVPCSYPNLINAPDMFAGCKLSKSQAIKILKSIPAWVNDSETHAITLGIHVDWKNDDEILGEVRKAEKRGWTVTLQWNGTASAKQASTYSLRSPSSKIYAKVIEETLKNEYKKYLSWGHYITDWEKKGYHEFSTEMEARETFSLLEDISLINDENN